MLFSTTRNSVRSRWNRAGGLSLAPLALLALSTVASADPVLLFTDLTSGPNQGSGSYTNGAFVRLYVRTWARFAATGA